ncbi:MAG TPA: hypothetical protein VLK25_12560 [Allosphingosinicella sp.]|nr:hypothetical protein [Allosphingosinicella sp.]
MAARLAFYSDGDAGVLAPRGWHCVGISGSSGAALIVTPERRSATDVLHREHQYRGPGVQIVYHFGGTSGRFAVAKTIARVFPDHMSFARRVADNAALDGIEFALPSGPYPDDVLRRVSAREVEFATPAGRTGLGTEDSMFAADMPISGIVTIEPEEDMNVLQLTHKLAPEDADLAPEIARNFRQWGGRAQAPNERSR